MLNNAGADHACEFVTNISPAVDRSGDPVLLERFQEHILRVLFSTENCRFKKAVREGRLSQRLLSAATFRWVVVAGLLGRSRTSLESRGAFHLLH